MQQVSKICSRVAYSILFQSVRKMGYHDTLIIQNHLSYVYNKVYHYIIWILRTNLDVITNRDEIWAQKQVVQIPTCRDNHSRFYKANSLKLVTYYELSSSPLSSIVPVFSHLPHDKRKKIAKLKGINYYSNQWTILND